MSLEITERQIQLVQVGWYKILSHSEYAARVFYKCLFRLNPQLRSLFKSDQKEQEQQLMSMFTMAINTLNQPDEIAPAFHALGHRHQGYGIEEEDFDTFLKALLTMLRAGLRESFNQETEEAWREIYSLLTSYMKKPYKVDINPSL